MAVLLSGTTIGGHVAVHANNISTYALTSVPANVITTSGGQTIAGITYFSNGESLNLYGIRGRFANEYIHLYEKVGIGHPGGWGQGEANTPTQGLSIYGGINIAYARDNGATINTYTRINKNWGGGDYSAEAFTIRGTYPSITLRSTQHNSKWLIHHASALQFYYGGTVDDNNWANKFEIPTDGNIWMAWANANISTLLDAKQNASTAITTSNIGSQSVSYATTAGSVSGGLTTSNYASTLDGRYFFDFGFTIGYPGTDANNMPGNRSAFTYSNGAPYTGPIAHFGAAGYGLQLNANYGTGTLLGFRVRNGDNGTWNAWREIIHSGNYSSYVVPKSGGSFTGGIGGTTFDFGEGGYIGGATTIASNLTVNQVYNNGWFRNYGAQGMYNESYGTHFYSNGGAGWVVTGSGGEIQLQFRSNHQSTLRGYVYADTSNNIGFLNNAGNWSLRTDSSRNTEIYGSLQVNSGTSFSGNTSWFGGYGGGSGPGMALENQNTFARFAFWGLDFYDWNHGIQMTIDNNYVSATNSFRAPVFYDSNDTNYYGDFAGFSRLSEAGITNTYTYNYFNVDSSRAVSEFGNVGVFRARRSGTADYPSFSFQHQFGNHSWGQIARFHIEGSGGSDRPSVQFSSAYNNTRWNIGYCTGSDDNFRISQNMGYRPDGSGVSDSWGTERFRINTDGTAYLPSTLYTNEISHANGRVLLSGNMHIDTYNGNDIFMNYYSARGTRIYVGSGTLALHVNTDGLVYMPTVVVNSHSDNTKGYRIHNTSGTTVSAMFVNSSNQLVIAAGAVDQVNLNKKVLVNGVALGVNVAPSATAGRIDASNDIVAYSSSDERLKYNIAPIENALDKVKSLTGVEFDWKPEYKHAHGYEGHDTGIIAQQVEVVMPSAVRTNDTGFLAVRYEKLIGLLIEANKELAARVEELEKKIG